MTPEMAETPETPAPARRPRFWMVLLALLLVPGGIGGWFGTAIQAWWVWRRDPSKANEAALYVAARPHASLLRPWLEHRVRARAANWSGLQFEAAEELDKTLQALPDGELRILIIGLLEDPLEGAREDAFWQLAARPKLIPSLRSELDAFLKRYGHERPLGSRSFLTAVFLLDPQPATLALALDLIESPNHAKSMAGVEFFRATRGKLGPTENARFWSALIKTVAAELNDERALALLDELGDSQKEDPPEALLKVLRPRRDKAKGEIREALRLFVSWAEHQGEIQKPYGE